MPEILAAQTFVLNSFYPIVVIITGNLFAKLHVKSYSGAHWTVRLIMKQEYNNSLL